MTAMPSSPVNRPMSSPSPSQDQERPRAPPSRKRDFRLRSNDGWFTISGAENAPHERALLGRGLRADEIASGDQVFGLGEFGAGIVMDCGEGFTFFHAV